MPTDSTRKKDEDRGRNVKSSDHHSKISIRSRSRDNKDLSSSRHPTRQHDRGEQHRSSENIKEKDSKSQRRQSPQHHEKDNRRQHEKIASSSKRPRSRTPPTLPIRSHRSSASNQQAGRNQGLKSPERKIQRSKEYKKEPNSAVSENEKKTNVQTRPGDGFSNAGFDNPEFGNSGFANNGFSNSGSSGFNRGVGRAIQWRDSQGKPSIQAPSAEAGSGTQSSSFKVIVNELSAESIKREDNPLKGTRGGRRSIMTGGFKNNFGARGRGASFGSIRSTPRGFGTHVGRAITTESMNLDDVRRSLGTGEKATEPPLNPLAVPRGHRYFLHDHRDSDFADNNRLYDPRLDRGISQRGSADERFRGSRSTGRGVLMGWRSFDNNSSSKMGNEESSLLINPRIHEAAEDSRGGGFIETSTTDSRLPWRTKADEDLVWKHDKYMEISKEEVETKLELVDEVKEEGNGNGSAQQKQSAEVVQQQHSQPLEWYGQPQKMHGQKSHQQDGEEEEEYLDYGPDE